MFDVLLTPEERAVRDEARVFVKEEVPRQLILDMGTTVNCLTGPQAEI